MKQTRIYKLTDQSMKTYNGFQWKLNVKAPTLQGGALCSNGLYHAYTHPLLAAFLNPIHANISEPLLFQGFGYGEEVSDNGLKVGYASMKLTKQIELPQPTTVQRVAFALICAKTVYKDAPFVAFADAYLLGSDRSESAAESGARAAESAAWSSAANNESFSLIWAAEEAMKIN